MYSLKVCLVLQFSHWLKYQSPLTHAQNTARIWRIGKDPPCNKGWSISFFAGETASMEGAHPLTLPTVTVTLFDFPGHPVHSLGTHLSGKIPVKWSWAATLEKEL